MITNGGVGEAGRAAKECLKSTGRVDAASGVVLEGPLAGGRVSDAGRVFVKRKSTYCRVAVSPGSVRTERLVTKRVVASRI